MNENEPRIFVASDKAAYDLRNEIVEFLKSKGKSCVEFGVFQDDGQAFKTIEKKLIEKMAEEPDALGLVLFGKLDDKKQDGE